MNVGYVRVSTTAQNIDRQIDLLKEAKCEKIFIDKVSGAKGLLKIESRFGSNGRQTSNLYILLDFSQNKEHTKISCDSSVMSKDMKGSALKIYTYLACKANKKKFCFLSLKSIAQKCHLRVSTVKKE